MSRAPVDVGPFEPSMPASVRAVLDEARAGRGPAVEWLDGAGAGWGRTGSAFALLRGHPERLAPEIVGWLVGIATFSDDLCSLPDVFERDGPRECAPYVLEAFAVGLRAGVPTQKRQWKSIARIAKLASRVPVALRDVLPIGLASDQALARGVALDLARRVGAPARAAIEAARATAEKKAKKRLDEALAALAAGDAPGVDGDADESGPEPPAAADDLLARLLAAWAETFDPRLGPAIATIGAAEARRRGPLTAKSKIELEAAWLALAAKRDPGDVDRLLGAPWPGVWKTALARVQALMDHPPDPRVAAAIVTVEPRYGSIASRPFHAAAGSLVRRMTREPTGEAPAALLAEAAARAAPTVDVAAVLRDFYDDPSDPGRRLVLADALQTVGDPRGELIVLGAAIAEGRADTAAKRRAAKLVAENADAWTGALPGVDRASRRFDGGFLSSVRVVADAEPLEASADAPEWATIERLHLDAPSRFVSRHGDALARVLARARSLHTLVVGSWGGDDLVQTLDERGPFPRLRALATPDLAPTAKPRAFPNLSVLGVATRWVAADVAIAAAERAGIEALVLFGETPLVAALRAFDASTVPELRVVHKGLGLDYEKFAVRVRRDAARADVAWGTGRFGKGMIRWLIEALAEAGRREVAVALPRLGRADAEAEIATAKAARVDITIVDQGFGAFDLP